MLRLPKYSGSGIVLGWVEQILAYYYIYYLFLVLYDFIILIHRDKRFNDNTLFSLCKGHPSLMLFSTALIFPNSMATDKG